MAKFVIKKDGSKEPFDPEKIKQAIRAAAQGASFPAERTESLVDKVSAVALQMAASREEVTTTELKNRILTELDVTEPSVAEAWREYDRIKGKG